MVKLHGQCCRVWVRDRLKNCENTVYLLSMAGWGRQLHSIVLIVFEYECECGGEVAWTELGRMYGIIGINCLTVDVSNWYQYIRVLRREYYVPSPSVIAYYSFEIVSPKTKLSSIDRQLRDNSQLGK